MLRYFVLCLLLISTWSPVAFGQNKATFSGIKPGMKSRDVEREAVRLANKQAMKYAWPEEFWEAKILSPEWEELFDHEGTLVAREIHIQLYAVMNSGRCAMADATFREKLVEDGRSTRFRFHYHRIGDMVIVPCE